MPAADVSLVGPKPLAYTVWQMPRESVGAVFMIRCKQCGRALAGPDGSGLVVSISGSIMGDECIESYYFCEACGCYTVEVYWDMFSGEEKISTQGPLSKSDGDAKISLIRGCSEPWNKKCRCNAHLSYFGNSLD